MERVDFRWTFEDAGVEDPFDLQGGERVVKSPQSGAFPARPPLNQPGEFRFGDGVVKPERQRRLSRDLRRPRAWKRKKRSPVPAEGRFGPLNCSDSLRARARARLFSPFERETSLI